MKKNIIYIGNALSEQGKTSTYIETLSARLGEYADVKTASDKSNKFHRLLHMIWVVLMQGGSADKVLIDTYSTTNFYYALIISQLCRSLRIPYINILHGGRLGERLKKSPKLSSLVFKNSYKLVAPSRYMEHVFSSFGYTNVVYIPNAIPIKDYPFMNRPIDSFRMLWVRSFAAMYNPALAIHLLKSLKEEQDANTVLTMVGPEIDGSLAKVRALANSLNMEVNFTGLLSKDEWIELSKTHNVFINTTNIDNTPISLIEAMALGLPVVSTNVGGIPYLIDHDIDGILVDVNNVTEMKKAILSLKNDEGFRSKLVTNARLKVEKFDWDLVKSKWLELLG